MTTAAVGSNATAAQAPDAAVPAAPTCIPGEATFIDVRSVDGALVACYVVPQQGGDADHCWRFDLATRAWSFASQLPHATVSARPAQVTATATAATVCKPDGTDCRTVPLSGITAGPDDAIVGATNADRTIVAVLAGTGPVHVFDATGKRLATIKPWRTAMDDEGPAFFRAAHVLGNVLEVRIADTPMSSASRLYDARTGKKIADVFRGKPMDDTVEPVELGGSYYAFVTMDTRTIITVDVATGKQLASYPLGDVTGSPTLIARAGNGIAGMVGTTAFVGDSGGKISTVDAPFCAQ